MLPVAFFQEGEDNEGDNEDSQEDEDDNKHDPPATLFIRITFRALLGLKRFEESRIDRPWFDKNIHA